MNCRFCQTRLPRAGFSLGNVQYSGFFPAEGEAVASTDLNIVECESCGLVQLSGRPDVQWM